MRGFEGRDRASGAVDPLVMTAVGFGIATLALAACAPPWRVPWHALASDVPLGGRLF